MARRAGLQQAMKQQQNKAPPVTPFLAARYDLCLISKTLTIYTI